MNCPYCKAPMEDGTITGERYGIKWVSYEKEPGRLFRKRVRVTGPWPDIQHAAYFCPTCKKVIVDVADLLDGGED